jgi:hypothetical protein
VCVGHAALGCAQLVVQILRKPIRDVFAQTRPSSPGRVLRTGETMLFKSALALLIAWLLGVLGVYTIGQPGHVLLLVGLMLLLLSTARSLDARRGADKRIEESNERRPPAKGRTD